MKIAMVAPFSIYPKGTVTIRMLPIAKSLAKSANELSIIIPPYDNPSESGRVYQYDDVRIVNIRFFNIPILKYPITVLLIWIEVITSNAECVYFFKPKGYSGLAAMFMSFLKMLGLFHKKILVDTDDLEGLGGFADYYRKHATYSELMLSFFDFQEHWIPQHVEGVTVASRALEEKLLSEGIPSCKIFYIPNGEPRRSLITRDEDVSILRAKLGLENVQIVLLYTRFFEYRIEQVIDIFKNVLKEVPKAKLLVIGKGEFGEEEELLRLAQREGFRDSVVFGGWISFEKIPAFLALGDVALYPFDSTPLNNAKCPGKLVELMKSGRAIVASNVGQIVEYIEDQKSGILVDPTDISGFSSQVVRLLRNNDLRKRLGANAQNRILNSFNWDDLIFDFKLAVFGNNQCDNARI